MVHGDNRGLVLPPGVAPTQVAIVPIATHKEGVLDKASEIFEQLKDLARVELDDRENYSPGWKFNEWEMKGAPLRIEIGPRDIENKQVMVVRRDTLEKTPVPIGELEARIPELLKEINTNLFEKAKKMRDENTFYAKSLEELKEIMDTTQGFVKANWCVDPQCEETIKKETGATMRCIPFEQEDLGGDCPFCGKEGKSVTYFAKAY